MHHAKRRYQDPVRRFVDLEAQVDDEDEGEDEDEDLLDSMELMIMDYNSALQSSNIDDFIDDRDINTRPGGSGSGSGPPPDHVSWREFESGHSSAYNEIIQRWEQRATPDEPSRAGGSSKSTLEDTIRHQESPALHVSNPLSTTRTSETPTEDDYPLWRIRCRVSFKSH